ncbi:hypothetical protein M427DRAFT_153070 [Gonapodya prolifera JEL478]|uniref:N-acetyltransferase domain-containing protein n=1 Tax=Gonapodya prolifera (strain JEL478) TaxID=1344416 RepID=A0A139AQD7_GONPJ|nr:hypothetical protein M427DRAFT_153070 [Gonapodya prolifera JEL478]|eukprot:KXS18695.1 hypothetical protein M427DRAFT_153070 [Gonapodya prolifera JEL478]
MDKPSPPLQIRIRPYNAGDLDTLVLLWRLSREASLPRDFLKRTLHTLTEDHAYLKKAKERSNSTVFVAETLPSSAHGPRIAGFIAVSPKPPTTPKANNCPPSPTSIHSSAASNGAPTYFLLIHFLYVHPDYFWRGVGSSLLAHLLLSQTIREVFSIQQSLPTPHKVHVNCSLYTLQINKAARSFYEGKGFKLVAMGVSPPPENEPDCFFSKGVEVDLGVQGPAALREAKPDTPADVLAELIFMGTGTSSQVPNTHCLTHTPVWCRVCFEATCFEVRDSSTGTLLARGTSTPGHTPTAAKGMLSGNEYFATIMGQWTQKSATTELPETSPIMENPGLLSAGDTVPDISSLTASSLASTPIPTASPSPPPRSLAAPQRLPVRPVVVWNRNRRRNTGCVITYRPVKGGPRKNLLIDCGKSFYEASLDIFNRHRIRTIDALLLTHGHADAMFGLDDLRQFTIGPPGYRVQDHVDVYCNTETMQVIESAFPYLVDKTKATGGGDVSSLKFHVLDEAKPHQYQPVLIDGCVEVEPFEVEHGLISPITPYMSLGFRIGKNRELVYVSDVSKFPDEAIERCFGCGVLVLDALKDDPHPSHFSVSQAIECALRIRPTKLCLLVGWSHFKTHDEINDVLSAHPGLRAAGITVRAAYDGEKVEL